MHQATHRVSRDDLGPRIEGTQRVGGFTGLPALIRQLGADPASTLARAGLTADALDDAARKIPYVALGRLLREAAGRTQCAHFGLLAGRMWRLADLGLLGEVVAHSATVGEALQALTVHQHLDSGGGLAFALRRGAMLDVGYAIYQPGVEGSDQIYDCVLAASFNFLRELCGPGWAPTEVLVPHAKPRSIGPYRGMFRMQPRFNAEFCAIRFSDQWLERPVEGSDVARRDAALQAAAAAGRGELIDQAFRALRILLLHGKKSGDDIAQVLSMHRRTLNRRLRAEGTTFQRLLDQVRFDAACQLLADSDIALDDIAAALGYAGVSPFMRTFRRWAGTTPGRWRRGAMAQRLLEDELGSQPPRDRRTTGDVDRSHQERAHRVAADQRFDLRAGTLPSR